jgi:hypothetical protein
MKHSYIILIIIFLLIIITTLIILTTFYPFFEPFQSTNTTGPDIKLPPCADQNVKTIHEMLTNVKLGHLPQVAEIFSIYSRILCLAADLQNNTEITKNIPHGGFDNATSHDYLIACQRSSITETAIRDQIDIWRARLGVLWEEIFVKYPDQTLLDKATYFRFNDTLIFDNADKILGNCKFLDGAKPEGESYSLRLTRNIDNQRTLRGNSTYNQCPTSEQQFVVIANTPALCHTIGDNAGAYAGGPPLWHDKRMLCNPSQSQVPRAVMGGGIGTVFP